jgi:hypothetical protein
MTQITEQLNSLTPEEIKYIYKDYLEYNERIRKEKKSVKNIMGFMKNLKDLADAHFDDDDVKTEILNVDKDDTIIEKIKEMDKEIKITDAILLKLKPLNDML